MRKNVPSTIASMTGGEYELFATRKKFELRMTEFTNHLHSRYLLSFSPKSPHPGLHQIRVRLRDAATLPCWRGAVTGRGSQSNEALYSARSADGLRCWSQEPPGLSRLGPTG